MAPHAAGLEHVSIFLFEPQPSFRSDRSDRFGSRRLQFASRKGVHGNRGRQSEHAQEPGRRQSPATRRAKRIFQTAGRSAHDDLAFRRHRYELVARGKFGIYCYTDSPDHFAVSSSRPGWIGAELLKLRQAMNGIKDDSWVPEKKAELDGIIAACLGLHVEASTTNEAITPGQTATIKLEAINRCNIPVTLQEIRFSLSGDSMKIDAAL